MERDKTIDNLRGFAMFWVIVVHVLYWGNFFTNENFNVIKSFSLFEMPLFFFVTGACNNFSRSDNYINFVAKRFLRILIPYWGFAVICAVISIIKFHFESKMNFITEIKVLISWLVPVDRQITDVPYFNFAVWFVPVYLCIVLIIPLLKKLKAHNSRAGFALLFSILLITCLLHMGWIQNVAFYSFWTYTGLFYGDMKNVVTGVVRIPKEKLTVYAIGGVG